MLTAICERILGKHVFLRQLSICDKIGKQDPQKLAAVKIRKQTSTYRPEKCILKLKEICGYQIGLISHILCQRLGI